MDSNVPFAFSNGVIRRHLEQRRVRLLEAEIAQLPVGFAESRIIVLGEDVALNRGRIPSLIGDGERPLVPDGSRRNGHRSSSALRQHAFDNPAAERFAASLEIHSGTYLLSIHLRAARNL